MNTKQIKSIYLDVFDVNKNDRLGRPIYFNKVLVGRVYEVAK